APGVPGLAWAARWVAQVPGGGFLRDSQKFIMPLILATSVGFGLGVERLLEALPTSDRPLRWVASAVIVLPVALVPTFAWGASGRLFTAQYPPSWVEAESIVSADRAPGGILALP